jgi:RNA polymerase sigma-70 factor, ECF subfamily
MLGSVAEAEDVVQDAYLRWHQAERSAVREPAAFLVQTVTRLCLDVLKSARMRREQYIGPWLPEPVIDAAEDFGDNVTLTLMIALERLSPLERAAFLLHDVFGLDFDEVAQAVGREPAACRQLASRARNHVRDARPRYPVTPERGREIAAAFFAASRSGDTRSLQALLAADVVAYTDGGGKRPSALNPIYGQDKVVRFFAGVIRKPGYQSRRLLDACVIDGLPGFVTVEQQDTVQTTALAIDEDRIAEIYIVRNPDKLRHIGAFQGLLDPGSGL